jgi:putative ABC transport system permease protein
MEIRPILSTLLRSKTGPILVAAQVALTLAIICNALFVVSARLQTANRPSGVAEDAVFQLLYVGVDKIDDSRAMVQRDLETLRAIAGVEAAASVNSMPMITSGSGMGLAVDPSQPGSAVVGAVFMSGDSIVDTFGLELVEGRDFEPSEIREEGAPGSQVQADTVILSRHLASTLVPAEPAVGKIVYLGTGPKAQPVRIVGVVGLLMGHMGQVTDDAYDAFILPVRQLGNTAHYAVRTEPSQRARVMAEAEKALTTLRNDRVLIHHRTMDEVRERRYRTERAGAGMLVAVTIGLLLITASGIIGVASLRVSQRGKQIGVRRALGARRIDILRYFLVENLIVTTAGIVLGVGLAIGLNQLLVSHVELARLPLEYVLAGVPMLWILGLVASIGPAWRAATVPPAIATRSA